MSTEPRIEIINVRDCPALNWDDYPILVAVRRDNLVRVISDRNSMEILRALHFVSEHLLDCCTPQPPREKPCHPHRPIPRTW